MGLLTTSQASQCSCPHTDLVILESSPCCREVHPAASVSACFSRCAPGLHFLGFYLPRLISQIAARRQAAAIGIESVCRVHRSPASFVSRTPGSIRDFLPGPLAAPRLLPAWTRVSPPGFPFFVCADLFSVGVLQLISSPQMSIPARVLQLLR
jgi:hypothetical protein